MGSFGVFVVGGVRGLMAIRSSGIVWGSGSRVGGTRRGK